MNAWLWCLLLVLQQQIQAHEVHAEYVDSKNAVSLGTVEGAAQHEPRQRRDAEWLGETKTSEPYRDEGTDFSNQLLAANKRYSLLSRWGGQRLTDLLHFKRRPAFSSWGGKRGPAFSSWGGKRSIPNSMNDNAQDDTQIKSTNVSKSNTNDVLTNTNDDLENEVEKPIGNRVFTFPQYTDFNGLTEKGTLLNMTTFNNDNNIEDNNGPFQSHHASNIYNYSVLPLLWNKYKYEIGEDNDDLNSNVYYKGIDDGYGALSLSSPADDDDDDDEEQSKEENFGLVSQQDILTDTPDESESTSLNSWGNKRATAFNSWGGKRAPAFNSWGGKRAPAFNSWGGKRAPAFNSWGGKRATAFNSWGGKRATAFNSWGGKRATAFNSWGGKRAPAFNSWGGKRAPAFNSWGGKRATAFNSWGGKRATAFNSWGGKRATAFNSWGGKRATAFNSWGGKRATAFNSWGGKRAPAFNSWGGKRAPAFNSWGGKRAPAFNSWGGKRSYDDREDRRVQSFTRGNGKRLPAFHSWGGKRSEFSNTNSSPEKIDTLDYNMHQNPPNMNDRWEESDDLTTLYDPENFPHKITHSDSIADNENEKFEPETLHLLNLDYLQQLNNNIDPTTTHKVKREFPLREFSEKRDPAFFSWGGKRSELLDDEFNGIDTVSKRDTNAITLQDLEQYTNNKDTDEGKNNKKIIHKRNLDHYNSKHLPQNANSPYVDKRKPDFNTWASKLSDRSNELVSDADETQHNVRVKRYVTNDAEQQMNSFITADNTYKFDPVNGLRSMDVYSTMPFATTICCIKRPQYGDKNLFMQMLLRTKSFRDSSWPTIRPIRRGVDFYSWGGKRSSL